jgi:hypothetical protein
MTSIQKQLQSPMIWVLTTFGSIYGLDSVCAYGNIGELKALSLLVRISSQALSPGPPGGGVSQPLTRSVFATEVRHASDVAPARSIVQDSALLIRSVMHQLAEEGMILAWPSLSRLTFPDVPILDI